MLELWNLILFHLILCDTARILVVIPTPTVSHQSVFKPFTRELANRGHFVTVFSNDPTVPKEECPLNLEEINIFYKYKAKYRKNVQSDVVGKRNRRKQMCNIVYTIFKEDMLRSEEFRNIINKEYDLIVYEPWIEAPIVLSHIFKAPVILLSSLSQDISTYEDISAPFQPLVYQTALHEKSYNLSFFEKITQIYHEIQDRTLISTLNANFDDWIKKNTDFKLPAISDMKANINAVFWNTHPIWEVLPVPVNTIPVWGLHLKPKKELPEDLKSYLDSSTNGVIYVSFGSLVQPSFLPQEKIRVLIRVFSQLPYDILWKWDKDELPGLTENIKISKWFPQADILAHRNIKLFITQGGLQSTAEAIDAGVPLIGIPMLADQWYNTEKYVHFKIGLQLNLEKLHDEDLRKAIDDVITDESYHRNVQRLGSLLRDQPQSPLQRAVWWTEHVLRHSGAAHLRAPAANLSWAQYHQIDLLLIIFLGFLIVVTLLFVVGHLIYRLLRHLCSNYCNRKISWQFLIS